MIELKLIDESIKDNEEWGEGPGETIVVTYECPCGNGFVFYKEEIIPDFIPFVEINCRCKECDDKYSFDKGKAIEK